MTLKQIQMANEATDWAYQLRESVERKIAALTESDDSDNARKLRAALDALEDIEHSAGEVYDLLCGVAVSEDLKSALDWVDFEWERLHFPIEPRNPFQTPAEVRISARWAVRWVWEAMDDSDDLSRSYKFEALYKTAGYGDSLADDSSGVMSLDDERLEAVVNAGARVLWDSSCKANCLECAAAQRCD